MSRKVQGGKRKIVGVLLSAKSSVCAYENGSVIQYLVTVIECVCVCVCVCIYLVVKYRKRAVLGSCCPVSIMFIILFGFKFMNRLCTHSLLVKSVPCCYTSVWKTLFLDVSSYRRSSSISYYVFPLVSLLSRITKSSLFNFSNPSGILYNAIRSPLSLLLSSVVSPNFSSLSSVPSAFPVV